MYYILFLVITLTVNGAVSFPGEYGIADNWTTVSQSGSVVLSGGTLSITGPSGHSTGVVRSDTTSTTFDNVSQTTWVTFHWKLDAGKSLDTSAYFLLDDTTYMLASIIYGGAIIEGNYSVILSQGITFGFGLDSDIFKGGSGANLLISNFIVIPESNTVYVSIGLFLLILFSQKSKILLALQL